MRSTRLAIGFLVWAATFSFGQATPSLGQIVDRLEQAQTENHASLRAYTATREFRVLSGDRNEKTDSHVKATVNFVPPDRQKFSVDSATGNERGIGAVKRILQSESEMRDEGTSAGFTRANYDFSFEGTGTEDGRQCYVLGLNPKHRERHLVKGKLWVDAQNYLPRKVDGELAKSPSWWVKQVHVTTDFQDVKGMWLPTSTQAVADIRIFGKHTLTSEARNFNTAEQVASAVPPTSITRNASSTASPSARTTLPRPAKHRPTRPVPAVLGTGILFNQ